MNVLCRRSKEPALSWQRAIRCLDWHVEQTLLLYVRGGGRSCAVPFFQQLSAVVKHYRSPSPLNKVQNIRRFHTLNIFSRESRESTIYIEICSAKTCNGTITNSTSKHYHISMCAFALRTCISWMSIRTALLYLSQHVKYRNFHYQRADLDLTELFLTRKNIILSPLNLAFGRFNTFNLTTRLITTQSLTVFRHAY